MALFYRWFTAAQAAEKITAAGTMTANEFTAAQAAEKQICK